MTSRTKASQLYLYLALPIREFWIMYENDPRIVNWFIDYDLPIALVWYLKFLCWHICDLLFIVVIYRSNRMNQPMRTASIVVLLVVCVDILMFFLWFNTKNYMLLYLCLPVVAMLVEIIQDRTKNNKLTTPIIIKQAIHSLRIYVVDIFKKKLQ